MSRRNIEKDLKKYAGADDKLDKKLRTIVSTRAYTHEISISVKKLYQSFMEALPLVDDEIYQMVIKPHNTKRKWVRAINRVMKKAGGDFTGGLKLGRGAFGVPRTLSANRVKLTGTRNTGKYTLLMFSSSGTNVTHLSDVLTYLKDAIYEDWRAANKIGEELVGQKKQQSFWKRITLKDAEGWFFGGAKRQYRSKIHFSHAKESTVATATIDKAVKDALMKPQYGSTDGVIVTEDLIATIWKFLDIEWKEETYVNHNKITETKRIVRGVMHKDNEIWPTDKGEIDWKGLLKVINQWFTDNSLWISNEKEAIDFEASPSFREQAHAAAQYAILKKLMEKNKKYIAVKKIRTEKTKTGTKKRSGKIKSRRKATASATGFVAVARRTAKISKGKEKGAGEEASTNVAAELARLKKYIQSRLPAEVRRNMGNPALRNRTGRFSNSVQLLSLQQAQNTVMAKYTYLLSPYQTFENTGKKRWPMAYNPKPLIAKSIRNLALGRMEQKLTVRRV